MQKARYNYHIDVVGSQVVSLWFRWKHFIGISLSWPPLRNQKKWKVRRRAQFGLKKPFLPQRKSLNYLGQGWIKKMWLRANKARKIGLKFCPCLTIHHWCMGKGSILQNWTPSWTTCSWSWIMRFPSHLGDDRHLILQTILSHLFLLRICCFWECRWSGNWWNSSLFEMPAAVTDKCHQNDQ